MDILDRIVELRDERGWSNYKLAKEAKLPQSTLTNMFKRDNSPTITTLISICDAFGVTLMQFFSDTTNPFLTSEQNELLADWAQLSNSQKEKVMIYINGLLQKEIPQKRQGQKIRPLQK
ncbi:MAG: helix-turn-helix domain-containing protein [Syntrophobacterales bacterium]|nr:helix-turn-helix domain-containing protein [Syntrophobacterales bacterium]